MILVYLPSLPALFDCVFQPQSAKHVAYSFLIAWVIQDRWTFSIRACVSLSPLSTFSRHDIPPACFSNGFSRYIPTTFPATRTFRLGHISLPLLLLKSPLCVFRTPDSASPKNHDGNFKWAYIEEFPSSGNMFWYGVWAEEAREAQKAILWVVEKTLVQVRAAERGFFHGLFSLWYIHELWLCWDMLGMGMWVSRYWAVNV